MESSAQIPLTVYDVTMKKDFDPKIILCIAAHPDDLEFGVSGSVAKWVKDGATVHYLICTDGSKGSDDRHMSATDLIETRRAEQRAAAEILGVKTVTFFDYEDGVTEASAALKRDIAREIRRIKPDTVVAQDPMFLYDEKLGFVNHNDHRNVGLAAMDAVYPLARDHMSFPELLAEGFEPHKAANLLLMSFGEGGFAVDIDDTFETKMKALAAHESQVDMSWARERMDVMSREMGKRFGLTRVEAFKRIKMFI
jgi:LmbE family N-acetylglucosaminyl deacetylase